MKNKSTPLEAATTIVATVALALSILLLTFQVLLAPPLTHLFADWYVDDVTSPASHEELVEAACATLAYCTGDEAAPIPYGTDDVISYTPEVMGHLDDVKVFFSGMGVAALIAFLVLVAAIAVLAASCLRRGAKAVFKKMLARAMLIAPIGVIVVIAIAGVVALVDFNALFNLLHSFFFSSGSWLFPYNSLLICALPEAFWMTMGLAWLLMVVVLCACLIIASALVRRSYTKSMAREASDSSV